MEKLGIKSADDGRALVDNLRNQSVDHGRQAFVTTNPRGEPRELLRQFHYNYPFFPVIPAPRLAMTYDLNDSAPIDVVLPDGTIWVSFTRAANADIIVSFDGIAPESATLPVQTALPGVIVAPPSDMGFLVYGTRSISIRGDGRVTIIPYISTEPAGK